MVFRFWKAHGSAIIQLIQRPVSNVTQGIANVDWEVHHVAHSRYQSNLQQKRTTVLIETHGIKKDRIMFECTKNDVANILDKIDSVL